MISSKKGSLTHLALITAVACLSIGVIYGFFNVPFCWHCLSADKVQRTTYSDSYVPGKTWYCNRCQREWMAQTPWKDGIIAEDDFFTNKKPKE